MDPIMWRKSGRSSGQGDACVEVARFAGVVGVRDSKDPGGAKLVLDADRFRGLLARLKQ
ncbi:DUF397 domain-containing protein [Actinomadura sp. 21ATH]|uniref:DUF397 domain-containing protein n=1 Tax=Actinomadura sp. 21ATH TaxID=1735444 RepID=UPI0035C0DBF3